MSVLSQVERALDRLGFALMSWRAGALALVALALVVLGASALVHPVAGTEQLYVGSTPFGDGCDFRRRYDFGCPGCGMTRSFAFGARGAVLQAFAYNAAGATLFYGIVLGGALGAARLALRRRVLRLPVPVLIGIAAAWVLVWAGVFGLRALGYLPLPPDPPPL